MWQLALGIASVGATILQGASANKQAKRNAAATKTYGEYNAQQLEANAAWRANEIMGAFSMNSMLASMGAEFNNKLDSARLEINKSLAIQTNEYNHSLLVNEAGQIWQKFELDKFQFNRKVEQVYGAQRVGYAASGVMLDVDSPKAAEVDLRTEQALEIAIMQHGANIQATKLLDAAVLGDWETKVAVNQMTFESYLNQRANSFNTAIGIAGQGVQALGQANSELFNGKIAAQSTRYDSLWQSSQLRDAGKQAFTNSLFTAASTAVGMYGMSKMNQMAGPAYTPNVSLAGSGYSAPKSVVPPWISNWAGAPTTQLLTQ